MDDSHVQPTCGHDLKRVAVWNSFQGDGEMEVWKWSDFLLVTVGAECFLNSWPNAIGFFLKKTDLDGLRPNLWQPYS